jgi:hypothetical protein
LLENIELAKEMRKSKKIEEENEGLMKQVKDLKHHAGSKGIRNSI